MRFFLDTEFAEEPGRIELISIGIVSEDDREFYAESSEFKDWMANEWVNQNVLPHLWNKQLDKKPYNNWSLNGGIGGLLPKKHIGLEIQKFVGFENPEFWGYYADYDWVVTCWLFGSMSDLPNGWPKYCRDIKQYCDRLGNPTLPENTETKHHALSDARWNKLAFSWLQEYEAQLSN